MTEHKPKCQGCDATEDLYFFPRQGLFLCAPCADRLAHILKLCQGGLTIKELEFRLKVQKDQEEVKQS